MGRLIDADALLQEMETETYKHNGNDLWHFTGIKAMIECEPTVDPVVHGRWLPHEIMIRGPLFANYSCSECGKAGHQTNYCPYCGAKMDKEED